MAKGEQMKKYHHLIKEQVGENFEARFMQVLREENEHTNRLAKVVSTDHMAVDNKVLSFTQYSPIIDEISVQEIIAAGD